MGGMVTVVARDSKKNTYSFKVYTGFMNNYINKFSFLEEKTMLNFLDQNEKYKELATVNEHNDYDNNKALPVAYDYGILLFDYYTKTVISANNYNSFSLLSSGIIHIHYKELLNDDDNIEARNVDNNEPNDVLPVFFPSLDKLRYALNHHGVILREKQLNESGDTLATFLEKWADTFKNKYKVLELSSLSDIEITFPDWTFINGDGSREYLIKAYEHMKNTGFDLTDDEHALWQKELEYQK